MVVHARVVITYVGMLNDLSVLYYAGRAKNVRNILLKNTVDVLLAALAWWALGFAFAYGQSASGFIG